MPMLVGLIFLLPLVASVYVLQWTPPPNERDRSHRRARDSMDTFQRGKIMFAYGRGLILLVVAYGALTAMRTMRNDLVVEIWRELGSEKASIFATTETLVAIGVAALSALTIWIENHRIALRLAMAAMCASEGPSFGIPVENDFSHPPHHFSTGTTTNSNLDSQCGPPWAVAFWM
jgi:hypothetical protein